VALLGNLTGSSQFFSDELFYNDVATQSLRFDDGSSPSLSKTPDASNRKTHTLSMWIKRCELGANNSLFRANGSGDTGHIDIWFDANDKLEVAGASTYFRITNRRFRDVSSWYNIVFAFDTTDGTADNRLKIYVNGVQETSFATNNAIGEDADTGINANIAHSIGTGYAHFDGYMAEINFIDGTQLTPSSFGETKNGVWIPKKYTGSYGTNGFRLQFAQVGVGTASTSTIGADTSGNTNHYTSSGIVASDCAMPDSPENNFCTLNPLDASLTSTTISEGNLQTNQNADSDKAILKATFGVSSGKWYWEGRVIYEDDSNINIGVVTDAATINSVVTADYTYLKQMENLMSVGDIFQIALNMDDGAWYIGLNNTWYNSATASEIAAGNTTNAEDTGLSGTFLPAFYENAGGSGTGYTANFGQDDTFAGAISSAGNTDSNGKGVFKYAPPSGFLALCTSNLPEPTISPNSDTQADDHFNTVVYSGESVDGSTKAVTVGFKPDFIWGKTRNRTQDHMLANSTVGFDVYLRSNGDAAEALLDSLVNDDVTGTGFLFDDDEDGYFNFAPDSGDPNQMVVWNWKANGGTTSSNSDGSITSTVQANTTAGFSIVLYNGEGDGQATVGHGLGVKPQVIIPKNRGASGSFHMYHEAIDSSAPEDYGILLNSTNARADDAGFHNDTAPTSSVFTVGTYNNFDNDYVAYCFAEVEGYSKFGSYTGNSSADGTFVYLGFRPAFILWKKTTDADDWGIHDNTRDTSNVVENVLRPNLNAVEFDGVSCDFLSNGFKWRVNSGLRNTSGQTYIYMAFAEAPFKYANAR
jgi:hypothetical protein